MLISERFRRLSVCLSSVRFQLKPYQLIGLKWLLLLHEHKLSGILADEMVRKLVIRDADYF